MISISKITPSVCENRIALQEKNAKKFQNGSRKQTISPESLLKHRLNNCTPTARLVYQQVKWLTENGYEGCCSLKIKTIAAKVGRSRASIVRGFKELQEKRLYEKIGKKGRVVLRKTLPLEQSIQEFYKAFSGHHKINSTKPIQPASQRVSYNKNEPFYEPYNEPYPSIYIKEPNITNLSKEIHKERLTGSEDSVRIMKIMPPSPLKGEGNVFLDRFLDLSEKATPQEPNSVIQNPTAGCSFAVEEEKIAVQQTKPAACSPTASNFVAGKRVRARKRKTFDAATMAIFKQELWDNPVTPEISRSRDSMRAFKYWLTVTDNGQNAEMRATLKTKWEQYVAHKRTFKKFYCMRLVNFLRPQERNWEFDYTKTDIQNIQPAEEVPFAFSFKPKDWARPLYHAGYIPSELCGYHAQECTGWQYATKEFKAACLKAQQEGYILEKDPEGASSYHLVKQFDSYKDEGEQRKQLETARALFLEKHGEDIRNYAKTEEQDHKELIKLLTEDEKTYLGDFRNRLYKKAYNSTLERYFKTAAIKLYDKIYLTIKSTEDAIAVAADQHHAKTIMVETLAEMGFMDLYEIKWGNTILETWQPFLSVMSDGTFLTYLAKNRPLLESKQKAIETKIQNKKEAEEAAEKQKAEEARQKEEENPIAKIHFSETEKALTEAFKKRLKPLLPNDIYSTWFEPAMFLCNGDFVDFIASSDFAAMWVNNNYLDLVKKTLAEMDPTKKLYAITDPERKTYFEID